VSGWVEGLCTERFS